MVSKQHPAVDYVNSVNHRIIDAAEELSKNSIFLIVEDEDGDLGFLVSQFSIMDFRQWNPSKKFYTRSEIPLDRINSAIKFMSESGVDGLESNNIYNKEQHKNVTEDDLHFKLKESRELVLSSCIMHFLGFDDIARSILKTTFFNEQMLLGQLKFIYYGNSVITNYKQSKISSKPRNPHYAEALRIATLTWEKYPGASKKAMCENLQKHFNGRVSIDSLDAWIKKQKIQPPKPKTYTGFSLVFS
ncbi:MULTISPECIES: hypothetical protein [unclassified Serratia (in: enterobacteria)]|uniref:hypothetical protein n=1 Tax=unclassified Serratia (in: enterobacteria) TaxID=2647522 RepID=UPI00046997D3|nr:MULTISPECIES: hypothetical protein [unclassified Serratia (in: enterobacteria)]